MISQDHEFNRFAFTCTGGLTDRAGLVTKILLNPPLPNLELM